MFSKRVIVILVFSCFYISTAAAELKLFPMWERKMCPTEDYATAEFACYTFVQTQAIVALDIDLQLKLDKLETCIKDRADLQLVSESINNANILLRNNIERFEIRLEEKDEVLTANTNLMIKYQSRDVFGGALPWVITGVAVIAAAAFVGGYFAGAR